MSVSEQSQAIPPKFTASEIRKRQTYITKSRFPVSSPSPAKGACVRVCFGVFLGVLLGVVGVGVSVGVV